MGNNNNNMLRFFYFAPSDSMTGLLGLFVIICSWVCCGISAVDYGPSLSSLTGVFVNWTGPDIWSLESGRKVKLSQFAGYSTVIPLITGNSKATSQQVFQERGITTVGEFVVEAPPSFGVIAVIQELKLRQGNNKDWGYNSSCFDYIQFGNVENFGLGSISGKICGTVSKDDMSVKPSGLTGPRTFMSSGGKLRMVFNHAYVSELVDALLQGSPARKKAILRVEVAFTAFKTNCSEEWINGTADQSSEMLETFEACSDYKHLVDKPCISSRLLCNDVYNCGGDGDTLGSDDEQQSSCPDQPMRTTTEKDPDDEDNNEYEKRRPTGLSSAFSIYGARVSGPQRKFTPATSPFRQRIPPLESFRRAINISRSNARQRAGSSVNKGTPVQCLITDANVKSTLSRLKMLAISKKSSLSPDVENALRTLESFFLGHDNNF